MGDPKKIRKKYSTPSHPWQKARILQEIELKKEYGLKNKTEIWIATSFLKRLKEQVKKLNAKSGAQADKEKEQLRIKLLSLGLIKQDQKLDSVLGLEVKDVLERRLQTILYKKNLARSTKQARQFIIHRHITVAGTKLTVPSYLVKAGEEDRIGFTQNSALANPSHPERFEELKKDEKQQKKDKKKQVSAEEVVAFEEVPEDEEAIVKEALIKKKEESQKKEPEKEAGETKK
ncbi:MAG: 30S ribosomal protein S4 [Nanoarchaeota archaeon]|nr:30S ribosomal protein S4 [Nanoarchaeota archaeon]MBU1269919.1 30S ribosomal protein S4 [Nanoarchaeota archaeon]MBU1604160.1 30S ribosomal protein S4 [Nanoarchaeota archaeon]MBU2442503.1 30S ribosomal protein S4 [Nanoarchaeota archaeon]